MREVRQNNDLRKKESKIGNSWFGSSFCYIYYFTEYVRIDNNAKRYRCMNFSTFSHQGRTSITIDMTCTLCRKRVIAQKELGRLINVLRSCCGFQLSELEGEAFHVLVRRVVVIVLQRGNCLLCRGTLTVSWREFQVS